MVVPCHRVRVQTGWSNFDGLEGYLVALRGLIGVMVLLDGEDGPMMFGWAELDDRMLS